MNKPNAQRRRRGAGSCLELQARRTVEKYGMLNAGETVLVAVSGGADSVALLHVLRSLRAEWSLALAVAHFNHRLRGEESEADEEFVRSLSSDMGVPFLSEGADVRARARASKSNLEEAARGARYDFLRRAAAQINAAKIALGHNKNDQAETLLMRLLRGSGAEGLSSIHPVVSGLFIRPLIECPRRSILRYLEDSSRPYRQDASNSDQRYLRNRIRHQLIPYLEKRFNPRLIDILANEAEHARLSTQFLQAQARQLYEKGRIEKQDGIALPICAIGDLHPALSTMVIREALRDCRGSLKGISTSHILGILNLCAAHQSGKQVQLPGRYAVTRRFDELMFLSERSVQKGAFCHELPLPGQCLVRELGLEANARLDVPPDCLKEAIGQDSTLTFEKLRSILRSGIESNGFFRLPGIQVYLESGALPPSLTIRSRLPGDRYGGPGHRKVKKMLIDAKIDRSIRDRLPLLVAGDAVVWIPGFPPAACYKLRPGSKGAALITLRSIPR